MKQSTQTLLQFAFAMAIIAYCLSLAEWNSFWQVMLVSILLGHSGATLYRRYGMGSLKEEFEEELQIKFKADLDDIAREKLESMALQLGEQRALMEMTHYALDQLRMEPNISERNMHMLNNLISKYHQILKGRSIIK